MKESIHLEILFNELKLVTSLQEFSLIQKVNDHVRLHFRGTTTEEMATKCINAKAAEAKIQVYQLDTQPKSLIFQGLLTNVRKIVNNSVLHIEADSLSTTCQLDIKRRNRSFQDSQMSYSALLKQVLGSEDAFTLVSEFQARKIGRFYLQYEETDWQFLIRMASQLNTVVTADAIAAKPKITFGIPQIQGDAMPNCLNYQVVKDLAYQRLITENKYLDKSIKGLDYYRIEEPHEILEIGTPITFNEMRLKVFESRAVLKDNVIVNQCIITDVEGFKQPPQFNERLAGVALDATMQAVAKSQSGSQAPPVDRVKIKFNFENETFDATKAWPFPYATSYGVEGDTGWYCLPEPGDQLKIYFPNRNESEGFVLTSVRQTATDRMKDPSVKYFRNSHGKAIVLSKDEIVILGKDDQQGKVLIRLNEGKGVLIYSDLATEISTSKGGDINLTAGRDIKIVAQNKVSLKGKTASMYIDGSKTPVYTHVLGKINSVPVTVGPVKPETGDTDGGKSSNNNGSDGSGPLNDGQKNDNKKRDTCRYADSQVGRLSAENESKGNPGCISGGDGDPGGKSYGLYQFASNLNVPKDFMNWLKTNNPNYYERLFKAYSDDKKTYGVNFDREWKAIAQENKTVFSELQYKFTKYMYFDIGAAKIKKETGVDFNNQCYILKEVIWSRTVQHGPGGGPNVVIRALETLDLKTATKKQVVEAIYKESGSVWTDKGKLINESNFAKGKDGTYKILEKRRNQIIKYAKDNDIYDKSLKYFPNCSTDVQVGVWMRLNIHEKQQVLNKFCNPCAKDNGDKFL